LGIKTPAKFKGKEAFYEKMLGLFVKDLPDTWATFDEVVTDIENMKALVHKIKGTAGNLDIMEVYQCALQLETALRNNEPDRDLYQMFIDACSYLKQSIATG
jgi:HPt (histidine-containing phosphotransfer) domain-containing protein